MKYCRKKPNAQNAHIDYLCLYIFYFYSIEKHAQALGCRITRQEVSEDNPYPVSIATLKIPLVFPSNKGFKKGKY